MPWRGGLRYLFMRFFNEYGERQLAESRLMRRIAQLTIYQWSKVSDWATSSLDSQRSTSAIRITKRFITNLQNELKKIQGPKH